MAATWQHNYGSRTSWKLLTLYTFVSSNSLVCNAFFITRDICFKAPRQKLLVTGKQTTRMTLTFQTAWKVAQRRMREINRHRAHSMPSPQSLLPRKQLPLPAIFWTLNGWKNATPLRKWRIYSYSSVDHCFELVQHRHIQAEIQQSGNSFTPRLLPMFTHKQTINFINKTMFGKAVFKRS